jgi:OCT family organic cation transporter-like MFS transporter 4/5
MEMMGPGKRTFAGIVIEYFFAIGQLILVFIAYFVRDWRTLSWIVIILTLPFLSYFLYVLNLFRKEFSKILKYILNQIFSLLPESPRWLLSKNKNDKAFSVLNTVAKTNKRVLSQDSWEKLIQEEKYSVFIAY